jgi:hypothetical protein
MTNFDPVASAENKSSEPESAENINELGRAVAAFQQTENSDHEMSSEDRSILLGQVSKISMDEIDRVIVELQTLRRKLAIDKDRIQRDMATYEGLNQQVVKLTEIITDSVKRLPGVSGIQ